MPNLLPNIGVGRPEMGVVGLGNCRLTVGRGRYNPSCVTEQKRQRVCFALYNTTAKWEDLGEASHLLKDSIMQTAGNNSHGHYPRTGVVGGASSVRAKHQAIAINGLVAAPYPRSFELKGAW